MAGTTLGTAYVQIVPSAQGIKGSISNVLDPEAKAAGTSAGTTIGTFAKKAIKLAAIGTALKASLGEGGKLQQSYLGGLDTLYGDAADGARKYAREAASAGISMNEYSEQAVSFGAALKAAYGGDTQKAMEAANTAIMDMADNSAKMGTPIESVQQAYQGFAKGQYQLLDNLKLGYGGTKTEMERLLKDATELTGVEYNIDNLGDVYDAIHAIQGDLGLTGVAASEASTTLSGSFGAMKASFQNFMGSLALGTGVEGAMRNLITTASTFFFNNLLPMLGTLIKSLPGAIGVFLKEGLPMLLTSISALISSLATSLTTAANGVTSEKVKTWLTTTLPKILSAAVSIIKKFASGLITNLPKIVTAVGKIGLEIVKGLGSAIWGKITAAAKGIYTRFMTPINDLKTKAKDAATAIKDRFLAPIESLKEKFQGIIDKIKSIFPVSLGKILNFSLPKISVSGGSAPWGIGGKGTKPSFSVEWVSHAVGGIFTRPTLIGTGNTIHEFGEAGAEALVPLTPFWDRMDKMAENMQGGTNIVININGSNKDPKEIAEEVKRVLVRETNQRRLAWQ